MKKIVLLILLVAAGFVLSSYATEPVKLNPDSQLELKLILL